MVLRWTGMGLQRGRAQLSAERRGADGPGVGNAEGFNGAALN